MEQAPSYNQSELLQRLAKGDEAAFRGVYDRFRDEVYAFALGITRSVPLAEEIVQDSFIKLWQHREQLPGILKFENWFFTIVRNHCYTALRKLALDRKAYHAHGLQAQQPVPTAEDIVITRENHELVRAAIQQLPEQQRRVYELSRDAGLTYEEIAAQLNISRNTVKEHLRRAVAAIKAYLEMHLAVTIILLSFFF